MEQQPTESASPLPDEGTCTHTPTPCAPDFSAGPAALPPSRASAPLPEVGLHSEPQKAAGWSASLQPDEIASTAGTGEASQEAGATSEAAATATTPSLLLSSMWPAQEGAHYQIVIQDRADDRWRHIFVGDVSEATRVARHHSQAGKEAYFAVAQYASEGDRRKANAAGAMGFWVDIDVGPSKAENGKGYLTLCQAEAALSSFTKSADLPAPTHVVHSGNGLHAYWVANRSIPRLQWREHSRQLKAIMNACGLRADPARTADIASVMRIPGTLNHKDPGNPKPVVLLHAATPLDADDVLQRIASAHARLCAPPQILAQVATSLQRVGPVSAPSVRELDPQALKAALARLGPDCDEPTWTLRRIAPLAAAARENPEHEDALRELARAWSRGDLWPVPSKAWGEPGGNGRTGEEIFDSVWDRFLKSSYDGDPTTLATIYHDAMEAGWIAPATGAPSALTHDPQRTHGCMQGPDTASPIEPATFPNPPRRRGNAPPTTIPNVQHLLAVHGITARYDVIKKRYLIGVPGHTGSPDNFDNTSMTEIFSLANLNGLSTGQLPAFVAAIADRNQFNPVAEWICSKPWDGADRLPAFYASLTEKDGFPRELKQALLHRWGISAVAAAFEPEGFRCRGVLTLQGDQGIGKTHWTRSLVPPPLTSEFVKLDHHLDGSDKDSVIGAITYWIVEIGELDSSFRKDVARLKGFLTRDKDEVRRPYAMAASAYQRRTVFCATVNDTNFLVDPTGNTRWWTIPLAGINAEHGIDMQQLFAQLYVDYQGGAKWWLTKEEEALLEQQNKEHRSVSAIEQRILDWLDANRSTDGSGKKMTASNFLTTIGIENPSNAQCKEAGRVLRERFGPPKRHDGRDRWHIPFDPDKALDSL
jgi:hypothetical protein